MASHLTVIWCTVTSVSWGRDTSWLTPRKSNTSPICALSSSCTETSRPPSNERFIEDTRLNARSPIRSPGGPLCTFSRSKDQVIASLQLFITSTLVSLGKRVTRSTGECTPPGLSFPPASAPVRRLHRRNACDCRGHRLLRHAGRRYARCSTQPNSFTSSY